MKKAKNKLRTFLHEKNCLLVLDDVWKQQDIEIFPSDIALRCRILITTRNKQAVKHLCDEVIEIGLLSRQKSISLLLKAVNKEETQFTIENLPTEAEAIIKECGYLPLAINIAGSMIAAGNIRSWGYILTALQKADLEHLKQQFPEYPLYPDLFRVLHVSVEELNTLLREKYVQFAVFAEDMAIPQEAIFTLWADDELEEYKFDSFLSELVERSLIQKINDDNYTLHSLQLDYLKSCIKKEGTTLKALHQSFIERLGDPLTLKFDYAWRNYIWHLVNAGKEHKALELLRDFRWIEVKLFATDIYALLNDYELLDMSEPLKDEIYKALRLSSYGLSQYKDQLASQLLLRVSEDDNTKLFLNDCKNYSRTSWLRPVTTTGNKFIQPDRIFRTYEDRITDVSTNINYLIVSTVKGNVYIWDKINGRSIKKINAHSGAVNDILLFDHYFVTCGTDALIKVWNLDNNEVKIGEGHSNSIWRMQAFKDNIISASNDGTIRMWSKEGRQLDTLLFLPSVIPQIQIFHNNLLMCCSGEVIYIYNLDTNEEVHQLEHLGRVTSFIVLGDKLISASTDNSIKIWEIDSGYQIANLAIEPKDIYNMAACETSVYIGSFTDPTLLVLNTETCDIVKFPLYTREGIYSMVIYKGYLIASLFSSNIRIFSLQDPSKTFDLTGIPDASQVLSLDGDILYAGTYGGMVYSWNLAFIGTWSQSNNILPSEDTGGIICLKSANEKLFVTTSGRHLQCYNFNECKLSFSTDMRRFYSMPGLNLQTYDFALFDKYISVSDWDGNIIFLDSANGEQLFSTHDFLSSYNAIELSSILADPDTPPYPLAVICIQISSDIIAATTVNGFLRIWDISHKKEVGRLYLGEFGSNTFMVDDFIIFPISNGELLLVNRNSYAIDLTLKGHTQFVTSYGTYRKKLLTASGDGKIKIWSLDHPNSPITIEAHTAQITDIKVYNNFLISCSMDSTLKVWNLENFQLVTTIKGLQDFQSLQISNDKLIACSRSGLIGVYDLKNSFEETAKFISDDLPYFLEPSSKYNKIAFGGRSGKVHFLEPVGFEL